MCPGVASTIHSLRWIPAKPSIFNSNACFNPQLPLNNPKTKSCDRSISKFYTLHCPFYSSSLTSLPSWVSWASPFSSSSSMATPETIPESEAEKKYVYSVWALPTEDVRDRIKKLMSGLRSEFGGPEFEPHITVVGAISLTADDALKKFRSACEGLKAYNATVDRVDTGTFFYQCVYLLIHPTPEVLQRASSCTSKVAFSRASGVPKGHLAVYVGAEMKRFVIPISYFNEPSFQELLSQAEEAYGYDHPIGALTIPCTKDVFLNVASSFNGC